MAQSHNQTRRQAITLSHEQTSKRANNRASKRAVEQAVKRTSERERACAEQASKQGSKQARTRPSEQTSHSRNQPSKPVCPPVRPSARSVCPSFRPQSSVHPSCPSSLSCVRPAGPGRSVGRSVPYGLVRPRPSFRPSGHEFVGAYVCHSLNRPCTRPASRHLVSASSVSPRCHPLSVQCGDGTAPSVPRGQTKMRGFYFPALANTPVPENKKLRFCFRGLR